MSLLAADQTAVERARERLASVKSLYSEGAVSARQVEQAELLLKQALEDASDESAVFRETPLEEITDEQAAAMTDVARRRLAREEAKLAEAAKLVSAGVAPLSTLLPYEADVASARQTLLSTEDLAKTIEELTAQLEAEEADLPPEEGPMQGPMPVMTRFVGTKHFSTTSDLKKLLLAYQKQFDRKLPITARGQTALHRRMGFNHQGRIDIGVNPDDPEGRWLMSYLEKEKIPFFAFRSRIRGQATAPHIHIGPPSSRIRRFR